MFMTHLRSKRVYKPAMGHEKARQIIVEGKGRHFDPEVVDAFFSGGKFFYPVCRKV